MILLALLTALAQSAGQPAYDRANRLFNERKFQDSLNAVEEALRRDPKLVPALTLKAKLALAINRYDVARDVLEQAIAAGPSSSYAHFLYGFQFYQQNEMQLAIPPLQKAIKLDPRDPRPVLYLGLTYESLNRNDEALDLYRQAIRFEEQSGKPHADTLLAAARLLFVLDRLDECESLLRRAVRLEPASRDAHFELARLLLKRNNPSAAAQEATLALQSTTPGVTDRQIHYLLFRAYTALGDESRAARHAALLK